jgi:hypothetical protein
MSNEETTIIEIPEPEIDIREEAVEQSGIKVWQPITWREKAKENWRNLLVLTIATIISLVLAVCLILTVQAKGRTEDTLKATQTKLRASQKQADNLQVDLNSANSKISLCQDRLTTAWSAWERRNNVFVSVLGNIFSDNTSAIDQDNTQAGLDILNGRDCDPTLAY